MEIFILDANILDKIIGKEDPKKVNIGVREQEIGSNLNYAYTK